MNPAAQETAPPEVPVLDPWSEDVGRNAVLEELYGSLGDAGTLARRQLSLIASLAARLVWRDDDCVDMVQWVAIHLGIGTHRARRLTDCARAIEDLPLISQALETGVLSLDKTVELTRFATPDSERKLLSWARKVAPSTIKRRADEACALDSEKTKEQRNDRFLRWNVYEDNVFFNGLLPVDRGLPFVKAIEATADKLSQAPSEERPGYEHNPKEQRCVDALVELVLGGGATVATELVVHTKLSDVGFSNGVTREGGILSPQTVDRLACDTRLRFVLTDDDGNPLGIGTASAAIPVWLRHEALKRFDYSCSFPGCDQRRGLQVHHSAHAAYLGPTDLDWLAPCCPRHHDLIHHHGWRMAVRPGGRADWFRPDGSLYIPGPSPPPEPE